MKIEDVRPTSPVSQERLQTRLAAYSRYAAVVQDQLRALQEEDIDKFTELADERTTIQEELESASDVLPPEDELDPEGVQLLNGAKQELGKALVQDKEIEARLLRLRAEVGGQIRATSERKGNAKQYVTESERPSEERTHRLNVRL